MKVAMNYKKYLIFLSFSLMFTAISCYTEDIYANVAAHEEISAVEEIPNAEPTESEESDLDFDLDDLNTADVNALLEQVKEIEKQPHDTTISQKLQLAKAFFEMKIKNAWDEFKEEPVVYSIATASVIASAIAFVYVIGHLNKSPKVCKKSSRHK